VVPFATQMLQRVPDGVASAVLATAGDNLGDGYRCVADHLVRRPESDVLILGGVSSGIGIGTVPLYAVMFAVALGARSVGYVDADESRRNTAGLCGATVSRDLPTSSTAKFDLVVDGTLFDPNGLTAACRALRPDGTVVGAAMYLADPNFPIWISI
jgi:threonine dehydrogenase-like Zn-dependent dehydrogenase